MTNASRCYDAGHHIRPPTAARRRCHGRPPAHANFAPQFGTQAPGNQDERAMIPARDDVPMRSYRCILPPKPPISCATPVAARSVLPEEHPERSVPPDRGTGVRNIPQWISSKSARRPRWMRSLQAPSCRTASTFACLRVYATCGGGHWHDNLDQHVASVCERRIHASRRACRSHRSVVDSAANRA